MRRFFLPTFFLLLSVYSFSQKTANRALKDKNPIGQNPADSLKALQDSTDFLLFEGKYDKVILNSIKSIQLAERIGDTTAAYYSRYIMGATFMYLEDFNNAHEYADAYTKFAERSKDTFKIARAYNFMGALYLTEKKHDSALIFFEKALPLSLKREDTLEVSMIYYNLSESYLKIGDETKAQSYFNKAEKGIHSLQFKGLTTEMNILKGKLNLKTNNPKDAIENFKTAIAFAENGNYFDDNLVEAYKEYSNALFANGNIEEAFITRKKFDSLNAIQFEKEKVMSIQNAAAQFSVHEYKKQARQAVLETELISEKAKRNNILIYVFIGAIIVMGIFLIVLYRSYKRRKKLTLTLKEKNRQYLEAKEKSERLALAKSKFFSTVSHELRTPLYGVIGLSTVLLEDESLKTHQKELKHLKFSADYLLALINDVLQISKIESNTLEDIQMPFDLRDLLKSIAASFEYVLIQNKNELHLNISENIPHTIIGNRMRISQIIMNLLGNASKFTSNGHIYISVMEEILTEKEITIHFTVKDTGAGIPLEKQKSIFEEFQQVDSHQYKLQGTGLGLPIVKRLLEVSKSTINLSSEIGVGSSFSFTLTFKIEKDLLLEKEVANRDTSILQDKTILIVDDNRINQVVTKKVLENHGIGCTISNNGDEAISYLKKKHFDLVLMDINMPGKNGMETTKEIRLFNKIIPIIALTAWEDEEMDKKIKDSGMNAIVVKPYDVEKFLSVILKNLHEENLSEDSFLLHQK